MKSHKSQCIFSLPLFFACAIFQFRMIHTCHYYGDALSFQRANGEFLPTEFRPQTRFLTISESNLESLKPKHFSTLFNLQSLTIKSSNIPLPEGINLLGYLKNLTYLHIINSNLTVKVMTLFGSGGNIETLSLHKNMIDHIPKGFFRNLPKVKSVDLSCNEIVRVDIGAFEGLENLVNIDLSHNRIGLQFDPNFFSFDSTCVYCATSLDETRCPDHAAEKCRGTEQVDYLWAMFAERNISLQDNPLCDTFTVEGQLIGFTQATPRWDPQDGGANRNEVALNTQVEDDNKNYTASQQDPQSSEGSQNHSSTPTFPTEAQDGGCSFHNVTQCTRRLMKRSVFLDRVCGKRNKYVSDSELHPSEQEILDGTGDNFSATEREDIYSAATVPTEEATVLTEEASSRDVSEDQVTQEGERRPHGVEDASEDSNQCHEDEQGRVVCQGEGLGEDQEHVENSDHEEDTEGEKPRVPLWKRNFNVTFPQALTALLIFVGVVIFLLGLTVSARRNRRKERTSTTLKDKLLRQVTKQNTTNKWSVTPLLVSSMDSNILNSNPT